MNDSMNLEVRIDGAVVTAAQIEHWELRRANAVLAKLRRKLGRAAKAGSHDLGALREELVCLKEQCGRQGLREALRGGIRISGWVTHLAVALSGARRKQCVTAIQVTGRSAQQIARAIDDLMGRDTEANRRSNLMACPDHYMLEPRGEILEVIETTGGSPFPAQFFMHFGDESGLTTARDPAYAYQSAGTARLADGTVVGGVRHQFRDDAEGAFVRLMVEFPALTPKHMLRAHQWHLACEFSHWLRHGPAV